ncbi:MAG: PQQ-binding-like beta-propeller repeat protein [Gemmataceae bacterium]
MGLESLEGRCLPASSVTAPGAFLGSAALAGAVGRPVAAVTTTYFTDRRGGLFTVDVATGRTTSLGSVGVTLFDIAYSPTGQLYGVNSNGRLYRVSGLGSSPRAELVAPLRDPRGRVVFANALEFRSDGRLFAAGYNGVYAVNVNTGTCALLFALPGRDNSAGDLAFDPAGNLYATTTAGFLVRRTPAGAVSRMRTGRGDLYGLVWRDGALYAFSDRTGGIFRILYGKGMARISTLATGPGAYGATQFTGAPSNPGTTYFTDRDGGLFTVDVATGRTTSLGNVGVTLFDLAYSPTGQLYGVDSGGGLYRISGLGSTPRADFVGQVEDGDGDNLFVNGLEFRPDGRLFASGYNAVYEVNADTGDAGLVFNLPDGEDSAGDLVFDPSGNLYVTTREGDLVRRTPAGAVSRMQTGRDDLYGLVWRDGALYAFADGTGDIYRITYGVAMALSSTLDTGPGAHGATQYAGPAPSGPTTYFTDRRGGLFTVDVATGRTTSLGSVGLVLFDLAMSPSGQLYGVNSSGRLYLVSGLGSSPRAELVASLTDSRGRSVFANALEFRSDGRLFAAGYNGVYEVNPTSGACTLLFGLPNNDNSAGDLVFDPTGNLYVTTTGGYLARRDAATGAVTRMSTGLTDLYGLVWRDGALYAFADGTGGVYRITFGGAVTRVSTLATGPGAHGATQSF